MYVLNTNVKLMMGVCPQLNCKDSHLIQDFEKMHIMHTIVDCFIYFSVKTREHLNSSVHLVAGSASLGGQKLREAFHQLLLITLLDK